MLLNQKHICWNITTRCNASCSFCHRMNNVYELPYSLNNAILDKLISCGVRRITWTGGEALLYSEIEFLIKKSKENGIINHLITNGKAFTTEMISKLAPKLDIVTLSLDSCNSETNEKMGRGKNQYEDVSLIVSYLRQHYPHLKIKINTVASKMNIDNLLEITEFILHNDIDRWKIFRFMDLRGEAIIQKDKFWITFQEFEDLKSKISQILIPKNYSEYYFVDINDFEDDYILIRADGAVVVTRNKKDLILGNLIFDDMIDLLSRNNIC